MAAYQPPPLSPNTTKGHVIEPLFIEAKADVKRMLEILEHVGSAAPEMQKTRTEVLRRAVEAIHW
jgi:hypothetical protein